MEWKEHIAWLVPILTTVIAYLLFRYGPVMARNVQLRRATVAMLSVAVFASVVAGTLGAIITKVAPNMFLNMP